KNYNAGLAIGEFTINSELSNTPTVNCPDTFNASASPITTFSSLSAYSQINVFGAAGPVVYSLTSPPSHGTASVSSTGKVKYTPKKNYSGTDSLNVTVSDGVHVPVTITIVEFVTKDGCEPGQT